MARADDVSWPTMSVAALTMLAMAGTWAMLIACVRWPMSSPGVLAPVQSLMLGGGVMLAWIAADNRVDTLRWRSHAVTLLISIGVLFCPALVWVLGAAASPIIFAILAVAWALGLRVVARDLRGVSRLDTLAGAAFGVALGVVYFFVVNTKGYANVFSPEQTILGIQHRDTMYQASIAAMLGGYRTGSTGLDGLVPIRYHMLSHALMGVSSRWMGVAPMHIYYLVPQIVGIPLLFFSLVVATGSLIGRHAGTRGALSVVLLPLVLLFLVETRDWASYLVSESYAHALTLLLLAVPVLVEVGERREDGALWMRALGLAVVGTALLLAKNSVGAVFAAGVVYVFARSYGVFSMRSFACLATTLLILFIGLRMTVAPSGATQSLWGPWHFVRAYPDAAWPNITAIAAGLAVSALGWRQLQTRSGQVAIEVLCVLTLAALVPGLLLQLGAGSAYYFINVGVWTSIAGAAGTLLLSLPRLDRVRGRVVILLLVVAAVALSVSSEKRHAPVAFAALMSRLEATTVAAGSTSLPEGEVQQLLRDLSPGDSGRRDFAAAIALTPGGRMASGVARTAATMHGRLAVFVPPENSAFWNLSSLCTGQPFFIPALTGFPLIQGLPPDRARCALDADTGFGYADYGESSRSIALSDSALCTKLRLRGFDAAVALESPDVARPVVCG